MDAAQAKRGFPKSWPKSRSPDYAAVLERLDWSRTKEKKKKKKNEEEEG